MRFLFTLVASLFFLHSISQNIYFKSVSKNKNLPLGGLKEAKKMMFNEMEYPLEDIKAQIDGSVAIQYQLPPSGIPQEISIIQHASPTLDKEAMRLFKKIQFDNIKNRPVLENRYEVMTFAFSRKDWVKVYKKRGYQEVFYPHEPIDTSETLFQYVELKEEKPYALFDEKENYKSYMQFIGAKLQYPEEAKRLGLKGEVVVSFVIEQSGRISNVHVLKEMSAGCTEEALRLIKMINWYPGRKDYKAVRTQMISSIGFGVNSIPFYGSFNAGGSGGN